jgi:hypothetical protein
VNAKRPGEPGHSLTPTRIERSVARGATPLTAADRQAFDREIRAMNERIALRREAVADAPDLPIPAPRWADRVLDVRGELVAIHRDTGEPYPLRLMELDPTSAAVVIVRRLLSAGTSLAECRRFLSVFELEPHERRWLLRDLEEAP